LYPDGVVLNEVLALFRPNLNNDVLNFGGLGQGKVTGLVQSMLEVGGEGAENLVHKVQGSTGPSTQMYIMNLMNQILGSLTSDFQHALNKTGYFTLPQATKIKDIIV
jgi:hypothetical protein